MTFQNPALQEQQRLIRFAPIERPSRQNIHRKITTRILDENNEPAVGGVPLQTVQTLNVCEAITLQINNGHKAIVNCQHAQYQQNTRRRGRTSAGRVPVCVSAGADRWVGYFPKWLSRTLVWNFCFGIRKLVCCRGLGWFGGWENFGSIVDIVMREVENLSGKSA